MAPLMEALCAGLIALVLLVVGVLIASAYQIDAERRRSGHARRNKS